MEVRRSWCGGVMCGVMCGMVSGVVCGVCEYIICMMCMCKYIQVVSSSLWHAALELVCVLL